MTQRLDERVISKIEELVGEGVRSVDEMKRHLKIFVHDDLFRGKEQPQRSNRRYFPRVKTIKNHMYNAAMRARLSFMGQDNIDSPVAAKIGKICTKRTKSVFLSPRLLSQIEMFLGV